MTLNGRDKTIAIRGRRRAPSLAGLPSALAGDIAFRIFCTPELSQYRSSDHDVLTERARFHLRNATWERVPTPVGISFCSTTKGPMVRFPPPHSSAS